jgi:HSP20 family protein
MFSLMTPRRERTALARRELFSFFPPELASLFEFPRWLSLPPWESEPWGFEMEELENEIVLRAEVPGFEPSELEVTMRGNELTVRAEHTEPEGEAKERRHARLVRTMTLPAGIEPEKVEARYHNGVLEAHVPRTPAVKPRRIEVKT